MKKSSKKLKKEAKLKYLRIRLEDPNVADWEKNEIRKKLGIYYELKEEDFEKYDEHVFRTYIEGQIDRLNRQNKTGDSFDLFPQPIKDYYFLTVFSSILESDCFRDFSDKEIENQDFLLYDRKNTLLALKNIGFENIADELSAIWRKKIISEETINNLQDKYWSSEFKLIFNDKMNELIQNHKSEFLMLQNK